MLEIESIEKESANHTNKVQTQETLKDEDISPLITF
jgi:hypothetical protein